MRTACGRSCPRHSQAGPGRSTAGARRLLARRRSRGRAAHPRPEEPRVTPARPDDGPAKVTYSPSPRPTFEVPSLITRAGATRHIWGDDESGLVADWIYASTERVHALVFGL